ncbi:hypothetical protein KAJ87_00185 [Candidatus Pacearchaeota archaeon]|nr:hypothetical protein [Candidatus Pacearchaeota archaeon]
MELIISPNNSFNKFEKDYLKKIIIFAEKLLRKNEISIPKKIYFYNSFKRFIEKVLLEVESYGFNSRISKEIIKCALNNGTYGTIDFKKNSIIEMNFNPFNRGEYFSIDFLELIIHESLHLHLSKKIKKDINYLKFKFNKNKFIGNKKIIQFDEGYAEFMTKKILEEVDISTISTIKKMKISKKNQEKPPYKKMLNNFDIEKFDKIFENLLISNRNLGFKIFEKKFKENSDNKKILDFALDELKKII